LPITFFYVPKTYHYHSIRSEICLPFVNITLPSRQPQKGVRATGREGVTAGSGRKGVKAWSHEGCV